MQTILTFFLTTTLIITSTLCSAEESKTLLLPSEDINLRDYQLECKSNSEYICIFDFFTSSKNHTYKPVLNSILHNLNTDSEDFQKNIYSKILKSIQNDQLDLIDLEMYTKLSQKKTHNSKLENLIQTELFHIHKLINENLISKEGEENFIWILNRRISLGVISKLTTKTISLPFKIIHYPYLPIENRTNKTVGYAFKKIVEGSCADYKINLNPVLKIKLKVLTFKSCSQFKSEVNTNDFSNTTEESIKISDNYFKSDFWVFSAILGIVVLLTTQNLSFGF